MNVMGLVQQPSYYLVPFTRAEARTSFGWWRLDRKHGASLRAAEADVWEVWVV